MLAVFLTMIMSFCFLPGAGSVTHGQLKPRTVSSDVFLLSDQAADSISESITIRRGITERRPGEADTAFLKRVLPFSYPKSKKMVAYIWHASAFGKQLFFSLHGRSDNEGGIDLFVLDPIGVGIYTVQVVKLGSMGNITDLAALFFVDVDQDGQKELFTLLEDSFNEQWKADNGELNFAYRNHYQTLVFRYVGLSSAGRPQYREDQIPRNYLDELPTAAAVRKAIVKHRRLQKKPLSKAAAKLSK